MFEGQKTTIFWLGLIILGLASFDLFSMLWYQIVPSYMGYSTYPNWGDYWRYMVPPVVGAVMFILIGLYMMRSGTKKKQEGKTQLLTQ